MSLFGYPADVTHKKALVDIWGRLTGFETVYLKAKVVEEQKLIKNAKGEDIHSIIEVHLEGNHHVTMNDEFIYSRDLGIDIDFRPQHLEIKKIIGTDDMKKLIVYG